MNTNHIERFMQAAIDSAREGMTNGDIPIGAVVVLNDDIVSRAFCQDRTKGLLFHAELTALSQIDRKRFSVADRKQMTVFSTLEPCLMCMGATMSSFVGNLVYSLEAPADGAVSLVASKNWGDGSYSNFRLPDIVSGVLKGKCLELFEEFVLMKPTGPYADFARGVLAKAD